MAIPLLDLSNPPAVTVNDVGWDYVGTDSSSITAGNHNTFIIKLQTKETQSRIEREWTVTAIVNGTGQIECRGLSEQSDVSLSKDESQVIKRFVEQESTIIRDEISDIREKQKTQCVIS